MNISIIFSGPGPVIENALFILRTDQQCIYLVPVSFNFKPVMILNCWWKPIILSAITLCTKEELYLRLHQSKLREAWEQSLRESWARTVLNECEWGFPSFWWSQKYFVLFWLSVFLGDDLLALLTMINIPAPAVRAEPTQTWFEFEFEFLFLLLAGMHSTDNNNTFLFITLHKPSLTHTLTRQSILGSICLTK